MHDTFLKAVNECWGNTETMKFLRGAYFFKLLKEGGKHSWGYENLKPSAGNSENLWLRLLPKNLSYVMSECLIASCNFNEWKDMAKAGSF